MAPPKKPKVELFCIICGNKFLVSPSEARLRRSCGKLCKKRIDSLRMMGNQYRKGPIDLFKRIKPERHVSRPNWMDHTASIVSTNSVDKTITDRLFGSLKSDRCFAKCSFYEEDGTIYLNDFDRDKNQVSDQVKSNVRTFCRAFKQALS